jgi:hypothetical protein
MLRTQRDREDGWLKAFVLSGLALIVHVSEPLAQRVSDTLRGHNEFWVTPKKTLSS